MALNVSVTTHAALHSLCQWSLSDTTCVHLSDTDHSQCLSGPLSDWLLTHSRFRQTPSGGFWTHSFGHVRASSIVPQRTVHRRLCRRVYFCTNSSSLFVSASFLWLAFHSFEATCPSFIRITTGPFPTVSWPNATSRADKWGAQLHQCAGYCLLEACGFK